MGKLRTDLMGTAGDQLAFHKTESVFGNQSLIVGLTGFTSGLRCIGDEYPVFLGVFEKIAFQTSFTGLWCTFHNGQIPLIQFTVLDLLIHDPQSLCGFCCDDYAAGISVDAVAQCRGEGIFLSGAPFPFLVQVSLDMVDQRTSVIRAVVGMNCQAGTLIHKQNMIVFIDNVQLRCGDSQISIVFSGFVEEFVIDVQLQYISDI